MQEGNWDVEFYEEDDGTEPVVDWLEGDLSDPGRLAAIAAIEEVLEPNGTNICSSEWGKNLGQGLYELRIRHSAEEIMRMFGSDPTDQDDEDGEGSESVLLRVYFMTAGRKVILLVAGYDKGRYGGGKREQKAIATARKRITAQQERQRRAKAQRRKGR